MQATILARDVRTAFGLVNSTVAKDPKLSHVQGMVLIAPSGDDRINVVTQDGTTQTTVTVDGKLTEPIVMNHQLQHLAAAADAADVFQISGVPEKVVIKAAGSKITTKGRPAADYPLMAADTNPQHRVTVAGQLFAKCVELTVKGLGNEAAKTDQLTKGIWLEVNNRELSMVATNRFKLVATTVECSNTASTGSAGILIPVIAALQIERACKAAKDQAVNIDVFKNTVKATIGDVVIQTRVLSTGFPAWKSVMAKADSQRSCQIDAHALALALRRVEFMVSDQHPAVAIAVATEGDMTIEYNAPHGQASAKMQTQKPVVEFEIMLNARYLAALLAAMPQPAATMGTSHEQSIFFLKASDGQINVQTMVAAYRS
jgi:DNA polymerase-3 subunit beta